MVTATSDAVAACAVALPRVFLCTPAVTAQRAGIACALATGDDRRRLAAARKQAAFREILLWMTPSEAPKALQASECSELLDPMRASCWIFAQH